MEARWHWIHGSPVFPHCNIPARLNNRISYDYTQVKDVHVYWTSKPWQTWKLSCTVKLEHVHYDDRQILLCQCSKCFLEILRQVKDLSSHTTIKEMVMHICSNPQRMSRKKPHLHFISILIPAESWEGAVTNGGWGYLFLWSCNLLRGCIQGFQSCSLLFYCCISWFLDLANISVVSVQF